MTEKLPVRVIKALETSAQEILVLRLTHREASDALQADARALHPDFGAVTQVKPASGQIRFSNGSRIRYIGGDERRLMERTRGYSVDYIDGELLLDPHEAAMLLLKRGHR